MIREDNGSPASTAVGLGYTQVRRRGKGAKNRAQSSSPHGTSSLAASSASSAAPTSPGGSSDSLAKRLAQVEVHAGSTRYSAAPLLTIPDTGEDANGAASAPGFQSLPAAFYSAVAQAAAAGMHADGDGDMGWEGATPPPGTDTFDPTCSQPAYPHYSSHYITPDRPAAATPVNRCATMPAKPMTLVSMTGHYRSSVPEQLNHPLLAEQFLRDVTPWDGTRVSADLAATGGVQGSHYQQLPCSPSKVIAGPRRSSSPGHAQPAYHGSGLLSPLLINRQWFHPGLQVCTTTTTPTDPPATGPPSPTRDGRSPAYTPSDHNAGHSHNLSTDSTTQGLKDTPSLHAQPSQLSNQASPRYQLSPQNITSLTSGKSGQLLVPAASSAGGDRQQQQAAAQPQMSGPSLNPSASITAGAAGSGSELQSFWEYLRGEASPPPKLPTADIVWGQTERDRVYNFLLYVPYQLERLIQFGTLLCWDSLLAVVTLMPLRAFTGLGLMAWGSVRRTGLLGWTHRAQQGKAAGHKLAGNQVYDIICLFIVLTTVAALRAIKPGFIYYWLKDITSEFLKMSVLSSAFEITDKILSNVGMDVMEALSGTCTLWVGGRRSDLQLAADTAVALTVTLTHAITLMCQGLVLAVALNSRRQGLLALLIANNFVEIKGTVLKRWDVPRIWGLVCQDIIERLHLWGVLCFVVVEDMDSSASWRPSMLILWESARILGSEVVIDVLKHAVLGKFNDMRPGIYREYTKDLCEKAVASQSHMLNKLMGFQHLPTACLILRSVTTLFWLRLDTPSFTQVLQRASWLFLVWCCLLVAKPCLGYALKIQAHSYLTYYNLNFPKPPTRSLPSQLMRPPMGAQAGSSAAHAAQHGNTSVTLGGAGLAGGAQGAPGDSQGKSGGTGVNNSAAGSATATPRAAVVGQGVQGAQAGQGAPVGVGSAAGYPPKGVVGPGSCGNLGQGKLQNSTQTTGGAVEGGGALRSGPAVIRHNSQSARGGVGDAGGSQEARTAAATQGGGVASHHHQALHSSHQSGLKKRKSKGGGSRGGGVRH